MNVTETVIDRIERRGLALVENARWKPTGERKSGSAISDGI